MVKKKEAELDYKRMWETAKETALTVSKMECGLFDFKKRRERKQCKYLYEILCGTEKMTMLLEGVESIFKKAVGELKSRDKKKMRKKK